MIDHLLHCTITALIASGTVLLARRCPARLRFLILLVALLRFAVPTTWLVSAGTKIGRYLPQSAAPIATRLEGLLRPKAQVELTPPLRPSASGFRPEMILGWLWFAGILCTLGLRFARRTRTPLAVRAADLCEADALCNSAARISVRAPKLLIVAKNFVPGVVGVLTPTLILPEGLSGELSAEELEAVFAHELSHLKRRDNLLAMTSRAIASLFWFHPLVWWMERRMLVERELACDEMVLAAGARKEDYSAALGKVCQTTWIETTIFAGATGYDLKERLDRIMTHEFATRPSWALKSAPGFVAALALLIPVLGGFAYAQAPGGASADTLLQAAAYDSEGRMEEAIALLREGVAKNPKRIELAVGLGNLLTRTDRYREAVTEFERALNLASSAEATADIYARIGETYRRGGAMQKSIAALERSKEFSGKASLSLALILDGTGRKDRAVEEYRAVLAENPSQPIALNNLAYILAERDGNLDEALGYALQARQALPEVDDVADTVGWIYLKKRMADPAIAAFSDALVLHKDGDFRDVRLHLAAALDLKPDLSRDMRELRTLLPLSYTTERDRRIKELLRSIRN